MKFNILTIFPNLFDSFLEESLIKKSLDKKIIDVDVIDIRNFTVDKHKTVDDTPYGGGAGMLMKIEPIYKALQSVGQNQSRADQSRHGRTEEKSKIVFLTPAGKQFNQAKAEEFSKLEELTFICGRYEGIDARVDNFIDEKISIGPYVLNGGEVASMAIMEAVFRLIPGVLGNIKSLDEETFSQIQNPTRLPNGQESKIKNSCAEYPQYTRPEIFKTKGKEHKVPEVLLSGNHKKIKEWREKYHSPCHSERNEV